MLKSSLNYPYPVLRKNPEDYKASTFENEINVKATDAGFEIKVSCDVKNTEILDLIADGSLSYGLQVQCTATWLRKFEKSRSKDFTLFLSKDDVYEKVEICPCIVTNVDLLDFSNEDFAEEYQDMQFNIRVGELVACGDKLKFDAVYKKDILKNTSSIFNIKCDDEIKAIDISTEYEKIYIYLPKNIFELYEYHRVDELRHPVINAIIIVPVLSEVLRIMRDSADQNEQLAEKRWYKTIKNKLTKLSRGNQAEYDKLLDNIIGTAQMLVGDSALQGLTNLKLLVEKGE